MHGIGIIEAAAYTIREDLGGKRLMELVNAHYRGSSVFWGRLQMHGVLATA
jgi:hypothetical protein